MRGRKPKAKTKNRVASGLIQMRRCVMGLSQKQVGEYIGIGAQGVTAFEIGKFPVPKKHRAKLCDLLKINPHQLDEALALDAHIDNPDRYKIKRKLMAVA